MITAQHEALAGKLVDSFSHMEDGREWVSNPSPEKLRRAVASLLSWVEREYRLAEAEWWYELGDWNQDTEGFAKHRLAELRGEV